jgi:hypothetical protein
MAWTPESRFRSSASLEWNKKHQSAFHIYERTFIRHNSNGIAAFFVPGLFGRKNRPSD